jgi:phosphopantetheine--protein transferase-like protein
MDKETSYSKEVNMIEVNDFISLFSYSESCEKWFSQAEITTFPFPGRARSLAARYMVKKTISEKLKEKNKNNEIEILNNSFGKPIIHLGKNISKKAEQMGIKKIICSLSHSRKYAVGMTIFCY